MKPIPYEDIRLLVRDSVLDSTGSPDVPDYTITVAAWLAEHDGLPAGEGKLLFYGSDARWYYRNDAGTWQQWEGPPKRGKDVETGRLILEASTGMHGDAAKTLALKLLEIAP